MGEFDHMVAALQSSPVVRALTQMGLSGDFIRLDGNQAKRHHFLPQFLLRGVVRDRADLAATVGRAVGGATLELVDQARGLGARARRRERDAAPHAS